ncbi:MAG: hypothetical protein ACLP52_00605 [Streptosporangiaceae bacterium]|jgi:hypothetical protein
MMKFPYREEGNPPILRPTVDVRLTCGPTGDWTTRALIDTGSPITIFDRGVAEALVISIGHVGCETGWIALLGGRRHIQFEYVDLCLPHYPELSWTARVAFITDRTFQMPFQGILGREGFQDKFVVTFNAYENYFLIERPDDWNARNNP